MGLAITYTSTLKNCTSKCLRGFFVDWPHQPSPSVLLSLLKKSDHFVLAVDLRTGNVVGFITAISDGVLSAYIPLLEVLPEYQGRGIGRTLVKRMLRKLSGLYMVDLLCDRTLQPFYKKLGMAEANGMMVRNRKGQAGRQ